LCILYECSTNTHSQIVLLAIRNYCKRIPIILHNKTDLELIDIAQSKASQSQLAKSLIINRYLPKVLKDSKTIFNGQNSNPWDRDDIIQTGIKAIIVAINSFDRKKTNHEDLNGAVTKIICLNIYKYLNKKKTNYDPMFHIEKGAEFKKVFYNYFKILKELRKELKLAINQKIPDSQLIKKFNCKIETLKEVQFVHQGVDGPNKLSESSFEIKDFNNYIDQAVEEGSIDPFVYKPQNLEEQYLEKENRNINIYKNLLSNKEWEILSLLNLGKEKKYILKNLNISKQRFSSITKNIKQKIKKNREGCLPR
jgi:RNA polymerase sigma factor (sigma-70 family)